MFRGNMHPGEMSGSQPIDITLAAYRRGPLSGVGHHYYRPPLFFLRVAQQLDGMARTAATAAVAIFTRLWN